MTATMFATGPKGSCQAGVLIVDARTKNLDFLVANSHLSYLFGNPTGREFTALTEAPVFVDSRLSAGVQLADILGSCLYGYYYQKRCSTIPGLFNGGFPVTPAQLAANPAGPWTTRATARNYSHMKQYWSRLDALQFRRTDVAAPVPGGPIVQGFFGYREL
jgi:hypothetical protein